jgi:hypothetical protein
MTSGVPSDLLPKTELIRGSRVELPVGKFHSTLTICLGLRNATEIYYIPTRNKYKTLGCRPRLGLSTAASGQGCFTGIPVDPFKFDMESFLRLNPRFINDHSLCLYV